MKSSEQTAWPDGLGPGPAGPGAVAVPGATRPATAERRDLFTLVDRYARYLLPLPAIAAIGLLMVFPMLYTLYLSLHEWSPSALTAPSFVGLDNYARVLLRDDRFWPAFWRTLAFTGAGLVVQLVLGLAIAVLLNQEFPGRSLARTLFLLPMVATPVAVALIWTLIFNPTLGILNYFVGRLGIPPQLWINNADSVLPSLVLVDTWEWTPMIALICLAGLAVLPAEPYEAARIDGATAWQSFWYLTLPLLRPTILVALLFRAIDALKTFDLIYVMTEGGPGFSSETLNIYLFQTSFRYLHMGYSSSLLVIFFALVLGVCLALIKVRRDPS